jgi:hypothetical protein
MPCEFEYDMLFPLKIGDLCTILQIAHKVALKEYNISRFGVSQQGISPPLPAKTLVKSWADILIIQVCLVVRQFLPMEV